MAKPYKSHLNRDSVTTLCNLDIQQKGVLPLPLATPWTITCKNCLSLYYLKNEYQLKNTKVKPHA